MAYVLGYIVADGCIIKRKNRKESYVLNITSKDRQHLYKIKKVLESEHSISEKQNTQGQESYQLQITNTAICKDLLSLGVVPRKTYLPISLIDIPDSYFADFFRGFFDGDGTVYVYEVNGTPQIKATLTSTDDRFLENINTKLCKLLHLSPKKVHKVNLSNLNKYDNFIRKINLYKTHYYVEDCEKLGEYMYNHNPQLYLERKRRVFEKWKAIQRRSYRKQNYPSKIGWKLRKNTQLIRARSSDGQSASLTSKRSQVQILPGP